jgi:RNase P subunit RPR2
VTSIQRFGVQLEKVCWIRLREPRKPSSKRRPNVIALRPKSPFSPPATITAPLSYRNAYFPVRQLQLQRVVFTSGADSRHNGVSLLQHVTELICSPCRRVFAYALQTSVRFRRAFPAASCGVTTADASQTSRLKGDGGEIRAVYRHPLSCPRENACSSMKEVVQVDRWNFLHCGRQGTGGPAPQLKKQRFDSTS